MNIRQAIRQLVIRPGLAIAVIGMLAIGIGATTAIFSLFQQVLLETLPVPEPGRLVELRVEGMRASGGRPGMVYNDVNALFSYPMVRDLEEQQQVFSGVAGHADFIANVASDSDVEAIAGVGAMVSGSYFQTLSVRPVLGRLIGPQDAPAVEESPVVVLSYEYWANMLGADPAVVGRLADRQRSAAHDHRRCARRVYRRADRFETGSVRADHAALVHAAGGGPRRYGESSL